jgi:hypothetical protein
MVRRAFLFLLLTVNAVTPAFASACALQCAADMFQTSATMPDCHGDVGVDGAQGSPTPAGDADRADSSDSRFDASLMQAVCVFAATAAVMPYVFEMAQAPANGPVQTPIPSATSRPTPPPDQPPRA